MDIEKYRVKPDEKVELSKYPTSEEERFSDEELREKRIPETIENMKELHLKLHAEEEKGVVVVLQAMDDAADLRGAGEAGADDDDLVLALVGGVHQLHVELVLLPLLVDGAGGDVGVEFHGVAP